MADNASRGRAWRLLRWLPGVLLVGLPLLTVALAWGGGMVGIVAWYLLQLALPALGLLVLVGTLIYAARARRWRSRAVQATLLLSLLALASLGWTLGLIPIRYPSSLARSTPAATVRLPADGPIRVAWGGDSVRTNYHATTPDQRWAYDLVMEPYFTGSAQLDDYGCYGQPVLAPASGTVSAVVDELPDEVPGRASNNVAHPAGNHVAIRLDESGTYLLLAHLKPGSVAVAVGDRVTEGQPLGACGNSGNTSEPHIHIHHQRQDPAVVPIGFAEGLPLYFRDHRGPAMPLGGIRVEGDRVIATGDTVQHEGP